MTEQNQHSGHLDAELDQPGDLATDRLADIARECLQRWDGFPTIPGSRRWSVNGTMAVHELERRVGSLEEQLEAAQTAMRRARHELDQWVFADGTATYRVDRAEKILDAALNPAKEPS